jgi:hypothetical protein
VSVAGFRALVGEVRSVGTTLTTGVDAASVGPIAVSGMLAEQLAKELSAGAETGAVLVDGAELAGRAEVLVRIVAGDPSSDDEQVVRAADRRGVPVVLVQLWPQADWTKPFVLTPFVVECRAGQGFPVREIASRIVESTESGAVLASRAPQLAEAARASFVKSAVIRSALIGLAGSRLGASRSLLSLEHVSVLSQLRVMSVGPGIGDELPIRAGGAAAVLAAGLAFRGIARNLRTVVPAPLVNAAVAATGTWTLARAYQALEQRLP